MGPFARQRAVEERARTLVNVRPPTDPRQNPIHLEPVAVAIAPSHALAAALFSPSTNKPFNVRSHQHLQHPFGHCAQEVSLNQTSPATRTVNLSLVFFLQSRNFSVADRVNSRLCLHGHATPGVAPISDTFEDPSLAEPAGSGCSDRRLTSPVFLFPRLEDPNPVGSGASVASGTVAASILFYAFGIAPPPFGVLIIGSTTGAFHEVSS